MAKLTWINRNGYKNEGKMPLVVSFIKRHFIFWVVFFLQGSKGLNSGYHHRWKGSSDFNSVYFFRFSMQNWCFQVYIGRFILFRLNIAFISCILLLKSFSSTQKNIISCHQAPCWPTYQQPVPLFRVFGGYQGSQSFLQRRQRRRYLSDV